MSEVYGNTFKSPYQRRGYVRKVLKTATKGLRIKEHILDDYFELYLLDNTLRALINSLVPYKRGVQLTSTQFNDIMKSYKPADKRDKIILALFIEKLSKQQMFTSRSIEIINNIYKVLKPQDQIILEDFKTAGEKLQEKMREYYQPHNNDYLKAGTLISRLAMLD